MMVQQKMVFWSIYPLTQSEKSALALRECFDQTMSDTPHDWSMCGGTFNRATEMRAALHNLRVGILSGKPVLTVRSNRSCDPDYLAVAMIIALKPDPEWKDVILPYTTENYAAAMIVSRDGSGEISFKRILTVG